MTTYKDLTAEEKASPELMSNNAIILARNHVIHAKNEVMRALNRGEIPSKELYLAATVEVEKFNKLIHAHNSIFAKAEARQAKNESEFYCEVKQALIDEGRLEHVAANLIDTEQKLLAQARRLEII